MNTNWTSAILAELQDGNTVAVDVHAGGGKLWKPREAIQRVIVPKD